MQKEGIFLKNESSFLILTNGKILNINDGKTNSFDFNETQINLSNIHQKLLRRQNSRS